MPPHVSASPHGRGRRPFVYRGEWYGEPIPGAKVGRHEIACAADSAWLFGELPLVAGAQWPPLPDVEAYTRHVAGSAALYPFQVEGAAFLACRDYAILADEMGLGKTVQALCAAECRIMHGLRSGKAPVSDPCEPHVLILCPSIAKRHWAREVKRWTNHEAAIIDGLRPTPLPRARYIIGNYDILYGQRRRNAAGKLEDRQGLDGRAQQLSEARIPIAILDEAHNLRGRDSRRTDAVKLACKYATCVWALTATPMPNHVRDLYSLIDVISGGLAGGFWPWAKAYCGAYKGQYGWTSDGSSGLDQLGRRMTFFMLGRSKAVAGAQLPEKRREVVTIDIDADAVRTARRVTMTSDMYRHKENVVAEALRRTAFAKRPAVVEMAKEAALAGQKVVVFTYMRSSAEEIGREASGAWPVFVATGDQSSEQRDALAQEFQATPGAAIFAATFDSVGIAISLVGADLMLFADLSWEPWKLLQAEGRGHRLNSTARLLVRYVIAAGTIDEDIQEAVINKLATTEEAIGGVGDGKELSVKLGRDMSSTQDVLDRLFAKLTERQT